jgi:hypothetical protein
VAVVSSIVTMGMGPGPGGMITMGMGPSMSISTVSTVPGTDQASAWSPWSTAYPRKKKDPWLDDVADIPSLYVVKASLTNVNGNDFVYPVSNSVTNGYYEKRKPRVHATFKWAKAIKASASSIIIKALRIFRGKEIEEDFNE